jgi:cytoskeleton protein RodZ
MNKDTFGGSLKREREMRGVTLDEIAGATRIATRFLHAIENEQWDQLPGGVFNRGFVRAVARYLGLDEENTVAEYTMAVGDRPSVPVWTGRPPKVTPEQPWLAWGITAVILLLLLAGGWFGVRRLLAWRAAKRSAQAIATITASAAAEPVNTPPQSVSDDPTSGDHAASAASSTPISATDSGSAPAQTSAGTDLFKLKIEAGKKTKVTVSADANRVFAGTMKPGENRTFSAKDHFEVSAKDAGALLLEMNGKTLAPIGPPGHAGKITVTRDALKGAAGGAN